MKGKEDDKGKRLEQDDKFKLNRESWVLDLPMKDSLAPYCLFLVLNLRLPPRPKAVHEVNLCQNELDHEEVDGLICHHQQCFVFLFLLRHNKVNGRDDEIVHKVEEDSCDDDEHAPACLGVGVAHFCQMVHQHPESQSNYNNKDEDNIGEDNRDNRRKYGTIHKMQTEEQ